MPIAPVILVVDDEDLVRNVIAKLAERLGYRVVTAADGPAAVAACHQQAPAAAVLDVRMPELDGPSTLDALRAVIPDLPCVFASGDPRPYTVEDLLARGRVAFLNKPMSLASLRESLESLGLPRARPS